MTSRRWVLTFTIVLTTVTLVISSSAVRASDNGYFRAVGTVKYQWGIETIDRFYFVLLENGSCYLPDLYSFPQALLVDGTRIRFTATVWMESVNETNMLHPGMLVIIFNTTQLLGDLNSDMKVDAQDATTLTAAFGSPQNSSQWNSAADLNFDGAVDIFDALLLASNYGK